MRLSEEGILTTQEENRHIGHLVWSIPGLYGFPLAMYFSMRFAMRAHQGERGGGWQYCLCVLGETTDLGLEEDLQDHHSWQSQLRKIQFHVNKHTLSPTNAQKERPTYRDRPPAWRLRYPIPGTFSFSVSARQLLTDDISGDSCEMV